MNILILFLKDLVTFFLFEHYLKKKFTFVKTNLKIYNMKKITFLIAVTFLSFGVYAQQTLSHSTSQVPVGAGGVACASNPDQIPGTGDEGISDNVLYRAYTPSEFEFTGDFTAMGIGFIAVFNDIGGSNPTVTNTVRLFTSSDVFPAGTLTEIASKTFDVTPADDGVAFEIMFDSPVVVDASTELIVAVDIAANPGPPNNYDFRIAVNSDGEDDPSYLSSTACGLTSPGTFADIAFPDNHLILNLIGDETLGTNDFSLAKISVFPNPVNDVININLPSNLVLNGATLYDVFGRNTGGAIDNGKMNVSNLASGVYVLNIETTEGTLSRKVVIE